jgi:hypothetical protein
MTFAKRKRIARHFRIAVSRLAGASKVADGQTELEKKKGYRPKHCNLFISLVGRTGFEPVTNGLKVRCSTS